MATRLFTPRQFIVFPDLVKRFTCVSLVTTVFITGHKMRPVQLLPACTRFHSAVCRNNNMALLSFNEYCQMNKKDDFCGFCDCNCCCLNSSAIHGPHSLQRPQHAYLPLSKHFFDLLLHFGHLSPGAPHPPIQNSPL